MFDWIIDAIVDFFWSIFWALDVMLCRIVQYLYQMFEVFSGMTKVKYKGNEMTLANVFFNQTTVHNIYWGMAIIGIVLIFVFTLIAVVRKMFDIGEKVKSSLGEILGNAFKGIIIILSMNIFISVVLSFSTVLLQQVEYIFTNADTLTDPQTITFGSRDFATMARCLDTIGNYSLNPSKNSRYNVNACYNEIREDMLSLQKNGVFKMDYPAKGEEKQDFTSWQYVLEQIAYSTDLSEEQVLEEYNEQLSTAMIYAMDTVTNDGSLAALQSYARAATKEKSTASNTHIDRIIFLSGTLDAAKNSSYNENASINDGLRGAYMNGRKSMYTWSEVKSDFKSGSIHYILSSLLAIMIAFPFFGLCMNCIAVIFNTLLLYITAPPFIATLPLDDGARFKQWIQAFLIQTFGIFGSIITIRLLVISVPIIFSSDLVLFPKSSILNVLGKVLIIVGIAYTADKASGIVNGLISGNAAQASSEAMNIGSQFGNVQKGFGVAAGISIGAAKGTAKVAGKGAWALAKRTKAGRTVDRAIKNWKNMRKNGAGAFGGYGGGYGGYGGGGYGGMGGMGGMPVAGAGTNPAATTGNNTANAATTNTTAGGTNIPKESGNSNPTATSTDSPKKVSGGGNSGNQPKVSATPKNTNQTLARKA